MVKGFKVTQDQTGRRVLLALLVLLVIVALMAMTEALVLLERQELPVPMET